MPYLTYAEFETLGGKGVPEESFNKYLMKSSDVLDAVTNHFYAKHDIETDNSWRVKQFKKALCAQIKYFDTLGADTFEAINSAPQTFSAGRTSVSNASRYNPSGSNESKPLAAEDIFLYLDGTGLLFRGLCT